MNETIRTLLDRRSVRAFKGEQIKDGELELVLEAGKYAPTAANQQSEIFIVVQSPEELETIRKMNAAVMGKPDANPYYSAPTVILVLADRTKAAPVEDASLALGNMYNAAAALGLGACWIHREREMFDTDEGKALLKKWGIQGDYLGVGALALGYPDGPVPQAKPRKENFVTYVR